MGLTSKSVGEHYFFAAGTGILPFLDLFDAFLRKMIYGILEKKVDTKILDGINIIQKYLAESFNKDLKFKLFLSLRELDDFVGKEIIEKLSELSQNTGNGIFEATIKCEKANQFKFVKQTKERFEAAYVSNVLDSKASKVYICGPPKFNESIYQYSINKGIDKDNIILV